jgi:hypothetical protein
VSMRLSSLSVKHSLTLAVLGVLLLLGTACGGPKGTITGHFYRVGGPPPGLPSPLPGTIYVSGGSSVPAGSDGSFSVAVSPGTYTLSGRSPAMGDGLCHARRPVTVRAGDVVKVDVICDIA